MSARRKVPLSAVREPRNALELVDSPVEQSEVRKKRPVVTQKEAPPERLRPFQYRLRPAQAEALAHEAWRRARTKGTGKLDASEVLREILEEWMGRKA